MEEIPFLNLPEEFGLVVVVVVYSHLGIRWHSYTMNRRRASGLFLDAKPTHPPTPMK